MLTLANLQSICPDYTLFVYPAYDNATAYAVGDIVTVSSNQFRCIQANTGQGTSNTTYWQPWNKNEAFTLWLRERMDGACIQFLNDWIGRKFENRSAASVIERYRLYTATGNGEWVDFGLGIDDIKVVGHEFRVTRSLGTRAWMRKIALHFDTAQEITLYLYKSGNRNPIQEQTFDYDSAGNVQWFDVEWEMKGEGAYYLCYRTDEITGNAYNDAQERTAWSHGWQLPGARYVSTHPFTAVVSDAGGVDFEAVEDTLIVGGGAFRPSQAAYTLDTNGLNVQFYVGCSHTDLVIEQRQNFATAFSLFAAKSLLREMAYNPNARVNGKESNMSREAILYEIDGNPQGISGKFQTGLSAAYERALDAIMLDTNGIDNVCLPCKKQGRIVIKTI